MGEHKLVGGTLTRDRDGITARCACDWASGGRFTSLAASAAFMDHQERPAPPLVAKKQTGEKP